MVFIGLAIYVAPNFLHPMMHVAFMLCCPLCPCIVHQRLMSASKPIGLTAPTIVSNPSWSISISARWYHLFYFFWNTMWVASSFSLVCVCDQSSWWLQSAPWLFLLAFTSSLPFPNLWVPWPWIFVLRLPCASSQAASSYGHPLLKQAVGGCSIDSSLHIPATLPYLLSTSIDCSLHK